MATESNNINNISDYWNYPIIDDRGHITYGMTTSYVSYDELTQLVNQPTLAETDEEKENLRNTLWRQDA